MESLGMSDAALLEIDGLQTYFHADGKIVKAVDGLSVKIRPGETLGLVGESGSGKSVTSLTVMRLLPDVGVTINAGRIVFLGKDLVQLPRADMRHLRGKEVSMIFQEPGTSLNPDDTIRMMQKPVMMPSVIGASAPPVTM